VLYLLPIWMAFFLGCRKSILTTAGVASVLTLLGEASSSEHSEFWLQQANCGIVLIVVWVTAIACCRILTIQDKMRGRQTFLQNVIDTTPNGIVMSDAEGVILFVSKGLAKMFGYERHELIGQTVEMLLPIRFRKNHVKMRHIFNHHPVAREMGEGGELFGRRKDGSEFPLETQLTPAHTDDGFCILGTVADISGRKRLEETEQVLKELRRTNKALDEFAYVASHDLRTPLDGIKTLAEWIEEDNFGKLPEESRGHLRQMQGRIDRMNRLLNDLLDYSRAGRRHGDVVEVDVKQLIQKITDLLSPPAGFLINVNGDMPKFTTARTPLEQVLRNLISNAIKHHDRVRGKIHVTCKDLGEFYEFSVADDGPGIPPEFHAQIFEMFETLKSRDEVEGSGIGLALIKRIVENYDGKVFLESRNGRGATFRFTWPKNLDMTAVPQR